MTAAVPPLGAPGRPTVEAGTAAQVAEGELPEQTLAEMRELAGRYPQARSALLPMLHLVQSVEGCVTPRGIEACADVLGISAAEVSGVATFYTMYKRRPVGDYHVGVCINTLCAVMGGDEIYDQLQDHLGIGNDETTDDGTISIERVECNAACDYAPVVMVNWEFFDNQTPDSTVELVQRLRGGQSVRSTRGPVVCTWREAERVIAGFPDDQADEGPGAGPASLAGLRLARVHGWTAPGSSGAEGKDAAETKTGEGERVGADPGTPEGGSPYTRGDQETRIDESSAETVDETDRTADADGRAENPERGEDRP
ncbi:MAG: NADH-quinone oxidoreductase subunit NuoE [Nocardioidaceae bacterium]|nr:NADH-quinone oxidoreductase subunit NuoE [Nocardioidaceae bacterium]